MPTFLLSNVTFQYDTSPHPIFENLTLTINSNWKTGIVGRNGRGKSTLLQLLHGVIAPRHGEVLRPLRTGFFPRPITDEHESVFEVIKQSIAPFRQWEQSMEALSSKSDESSLNEYHTLFELYSWNHGFSIDAMISRECVELGIDERLLTQPFETLSGGERTRAFISVLFLQRDSFPLLDEPTNHLDLFGRNALADYLSRKRGFVVVSHDRHFLDTCTDHIVAINKNDLRVFQGNFSRWKNQMALEEESESSRNEALKKEITVLEKAARQIRSWSFAAEKEKHKAADSGFVSHKAAKMMKRALVTERRIEKRIEEKQSLLLNRETVRPLRLSVDPGAPDILLSIENLTVTAGNKVVIKEFSLTVRNQERTALIGRNGSGKTTLLNVIRGVHPAASGKFHIAGSVKVVHGYQVPVWNNGMLRDHLRSNRIDETRFRTAMGTFNIQGEIFDRPLETFSEGERKKVDLCRSCIFPFHLLVWDEPVNYIDIESKEQIESVILEAKPTMLFVEHDKAFIDAIATRAVTIPEYR